MHELGEDAIPDGNDPCPFEIRLRRLYVDANDGSIGIHIDHIHFLRIVSQKSPGQYRPCSHASRSISRSIHHPAGG